MLITKLRVPDVFTAPREVLEENVFFGFILGELFGEDGEIPKLLLEGDLFQLRLQRH